MNLIEAVKSGRRFRRRCWDVWYEAGATRIISWRDDNESSGDGFYCSLVEDLLADDYEVEEKKVEITRGKFLEAWAVANFHTPGLTRDLDFRLKLMRELGL